MVVAVPRVLLPITQALSRLARDERGVTSIEYGLIAALTTLAAIPAIGSLGGKLGATFSTVSAAMDGAPEPAPMSPPMRAPGK